VRLEGLVTLKKLMTSLGLDSAPFRLEGLVTLKKINDLIGTRIRALPACSIVPQLTTLPRAPCHKLFRNKIPPQTFVACRGIKYSHPAYKTV
jgi:hypothetical protein